MAVRGFCEAFMGIAGPVAQPSCRAANDVAGTKTRQSNTAAVSTVRIGRMAHPPSQAVSGRTSVLQRSLGLPEAVLAAIGNCSNLGSRRLDEQHDGRLHVRRGKEPGEEP